MTKAFGGDQTGSANKIARCAIIIALAAVIKYIHFYPLDAFKKAIRMHPKYAHDNLAAVDAMENLDLLALSKLGSNK